MKGVLSLLLLLPVAALALDVSGKVVDVQDRAIAHAYVWLVQEKETKKQETNDAGAFSFSGLAPGNIEVVVRKEGYALGGVNARIALESSDLIVSLVSEQSEVPLRIINTEFQSLAGARVQSLVVNNAFNVPIEDLGNAGFSSIRSDDDGRLTITQLPKEAYLQFTIYHPQYAPTFVPYFPAGRPSQDIVLYNGAPLRGRIVGEDGKGVSSARISVFTMSTGGMHEFIETTTDLEGYYSVMLSPGEYYIAARHEDFLTSQPKSVALSKQSEGGVVDVVLVRARYAIGVVMRDNGKPMPGVEIAYVVDGAIYETTLTGGDGGFRLKRGAGDGLLHVMPLDGFAPKGFGDIPIKSASQDEIKIPPIILIPLPVIAGQVTDEQGSPSPRALITSINLYPPVRTLADDKGRFEIRLQRLPDTATASFTAEHALRFLRAKFTINFRTLKPADVSLENYSPVLEEKRADREFQNDLSHLIGKPAQEIACDLWLQSEPLSLAELKGKIIALIFWGGFDSSTESAEKLDEMSMLSNMFRDVNDVVFIGIHDSSSLPEDVEKYVADRGIEFPVGKDVDEASTFDAYDVTYIPQRLLIDKRGVIRYFDVDGRLLELIKALRREER